MKTFKRRLKTLVKVSKKPLREQTIMNPLSGYSGSSSTLTTSLDKMTRHIALLLSLIFLPQALIVKLTTNPLSTEAKKLMESGT